ncbi:hypothetical protein GCM10023334_103440 [Nonomuraea thailandensis]|nr:sigma-70 family RNA polymerase sigma factor [Nonomuraea thailandensis]
MGADPNSRLVEIYEFAYEFILGYVLRRCPRPKDAADVVAETFTTAWRRIEELPEGDEARLWLYGVARRVLAPITGAASGATSSTRRPCASGSPPPPR